ncbi:citrate synthase, mitochondrial isoform X2 [Megachile rotundata]
MVRETSETDPKHGIKYRGLTIPEVIMLLPRQGKSPSAEAVFWLLLTGDVPTQEQTTSLITDWSVRRQKRKEWWSGPGGGIVGSVLHSLPKTTTPLSKLSVALTIFDSGKYLREGLRSGAQSHTLWEYAYEDGMELLATLPAIIGLIARTEEFKNVKEDGDWVQFFLECLSNSSNISESHKKSIADFLRLFITLNADENGGVPAIHISEILGASQSNINQALAAGVLAYTDEPKSGTMSQYMEFQTKIQQYWGHEPKEEKLKDYLGTLIKNKELIGYRKAEFCDSRYIAMLNYVKESMPDNPDIKLSQAISRILDTMIKSSKGMKICPEQNTIAAPVLQFYGMKDMEFNQVLLCMSRTLGAVASIIWSKVINAPIEHPTSKCTYTYLNSIQGVRRKNKRRTHVEHPRK